MLSGRQCRVARAALGWSVAELARQTGLSEKAIQKFEAEAVDARMSTVKSIERAFTKNGVEPVTIDDWDAVRWRP